jgi:hypothetical protein
MIRVEAPLCRINSEKTQSPGKGISITLNLRSLKMGHMADQERQSDYNVEIQ